MNIKQASTLIGIMVLLAFSAGIVFQKCKNDQALRSALIQNQERVEKMAQQMSGLSVEEYNRQLVDLKSENRSLKMRLELLEEKLRFSGRADLGKSQFKALNNVKSKVNRGIPEKYKKQYSFDTANAVIYGQEDARVTITAFYDFTCPFCAKVHPTLLEVAELYPEDVKIAFKQYPLISSSYPSAKMILAANAQGKYIEMTNYMFEHMKEAKDLKSPEHIKAFVAGIGFLDVERFMADLVERDAQWSAIIRSNVNEAKKNDISGTPSIFINGKYAQGRDLANFKMQINEILDHQPRELSQVKENKNGSRIK